MNKATNRSIQNNDNQDERFDAVNEIITQIHGDVANAAQGMASHDNNIYEALAQTLDLGLEFIQKREDEDDKDWSFLKGFLDHSNVKWSSKCEDNIFHGLVDVSFNFIDPKTGVVFVSAPTMSKYRLVLKHAHEHGFDGDTLKADLEQRTLRGYYEDASKYYAKPNMLAKYVEDDADRYKRAVKHLTKINAPVLQNIPNNFVIPSTKSGFMSAVVHNDNGQYKVVGFEDDRDEEIRARVSSLVPAEAIRNTKKLRDKNLYWLFVASDLFTRFLPSISDAQAWSRQNEFKQEIYIDPNDSNVDIQEKLKKKFDAQNTDDAKKKASNSGSLSKGKFVSLNALQLVANANGISAHSLTTHPNTPCVEIGGIEIDDANWRSLSVTLKDQQANQYKESFLEFEDMKSQVHQGGLTLSHNSIKSDDIELVDYSDVSNWRVLNKQILTLGEFEVDKQLILGLRRWKTDFSSGKSFGRSAFQNMQLLKLEGDELRLVFPNDADQFRILGTNKGQSFTTGNSARYFDFKYILKILEFIDDYGIDFDVDWLSGHQGASALRFYMMGLGFDAAITIPMMLSIKGSPVEITV